MGSAPPVRHSPRRSRHSPPRRRSTCASRRGAALAAGRVIGGSSQLRAAARRPVGRAGAKSALVDAHLRLALDAASRCAARRRRRGSAGRTPTTCSTASKSSASARSPPQLRRASTIEASCSRSARAVSSDAELELAARQQARRPDAAKVALVDRLLAGKADAGDGRDRAPPRAAARAAAASANLSAHAAEHRRRCQSGEHRRDGHRRDAAHRRSARAARDGPDGAVRPRLRINQVSRPLRPRRPARAGRRRRHRRQHRIPSRRPATPARRLADATDRNDTDRKGRPWQNSRSAPMRSATRSRTSSPPTSRPRPPATEVGTRHRRRRRHRARRGPSRRHGQRAHPLRRRHARASR